MHPAESWEKAQKDHRGRWFWSLPALEIFEIEGVAEFEDWLVVVRGDPT